MARKQRAGVSYKAGYKSYSAEGRHRKNTIATLERVVKNQPNNLQAKETLAKFLADGVPYTRSRRSAGHICKGMYKELGFNKNQPTEAMSKSTLELHHYFGGEYKFSPSLPVNTPLRHGKTAEDQLVALGFERPKRRVNAR